ncbi:cache domain-containing sensor histidine kinase [Paenibacillus sp. NRS-1760]|uniref:cache domain-containing sensor histidine kinase n=1 Tax=Paenibacillus sp. NRS-1760 TaxID=3233902 RepID=UPI003D29D1B7
MLIRQDSLRMKLVWSALICFVIPLAVIYLVTNYLTKDIILDKVVMNAEDSLKVAKSEINSVFEQTLNLSNFVLMNAEIRQMLMVNKAELALQKQKQEYAVNFSKLSRILDDLFIQKNDFQVTILGVKEPFYTNYSHSDLNPRLWYERKWFHQLNELPIFSTYWLGEQIQTEKMTTNYVTMGRPIKKTASIPIGYMIVNINERLIRPYLTTNENQEMFLLDSNGVVISQANPSKIGEKLLWWKPEGMGRTIEIERKKYVYVEQKLESNDWRVVSLIPMSAAIDKNKQVLFVSFIVQALFFSLFFVLLTIRISALTKPIRDLSVFVTKIGRGQLDERNNIRGHNEVGHLAKTIDFMLDRIQEMFEQITLEQAKKRKAELEMLQAQINPHFMFNLLNSIRLNILIQGDQENAELIKSLSSLLRMTINRDNEFIPLDEEGDTVLHYVKLMNFRHANQVRVAYNFEAGCEQALVPRFMIQPLIENAIIHGFEQFDGEIFIDANKEHDNGRELLRIVVRDNGIGMTKDKLKELQAKSEDIRDPQESENKSFSGIGVKNVFQRLRLVYGEYVKTTIESESGVGTKITLIFPFECKRAGAQHVDGNSSG